MTFTPLLRLRRLAVLPVFFAASLTVLFPAGQAGAQSARVAMAARTGSSLPAAIDVGEMPSSERISMTLTVAPTADRVALLDQFLSGVTTPSSASYHKWLTPAQFAETYGATADQLAAAAQWVEANGLSLDAISPSGMRFKVSGAVSQIEPALAVAMHSYHVGGGLYYAPDTTPSLPASAAAVFAAIDGLDNLPTTGAAGAPSSALSLPVLGAAVDANTTGIMTIDATAASGTLTAAQLAGYQALFRQAAAQGITTLIGRTAGTTGFPANLLDMTAVTLAGGAADTTTPVDARPWWQDAPGLPADGLRYGPDVTVSSVAALQQTLASIAVRAGGRLGNVASTLYELAPTPGLYTQPQAAVAGAWESATGLGTVDLAKLAAVFPLGSSSSQTAVTSSQSSPVHGQSFTLSTTVTSTTGGATPTGTVTFTATQAAFNSQTVTLNSAGMANSTGYSLPGGTYNITATYSGDGTYSSSYGTMTVTVQAEAANFTISAPSSVALGANVTATVTLTSASGFGTPNVNVTVTPSGITGAAAITQTLNGTGGTSTGTFTFTTKSAGSVSLQASCTSNDSSFTCFTPQTATTTVPQTTPGVTLTASTTSPTAGTPVTFTAAVAGVTGIGATGSVQFFDGTTSLGFGSAPSATFMTTLSAGTSHSITAVYQGDMNYVKATSNAVSVPVGTAPTTTVVNASASTATYGQTVTLNITVTGSPTVNGTLPTGTLTFTGAGTTTTAAVSGGSANVALSSLPVGTYTITTAYSGDANYSASSGNTVVLTVTAATASLATSISSNVFTQGSTSSLTATVTLPGNAQLPTGSTFVATIVGVTGATYTGTFTVNTGGNTGTGTITIPAPIAGSYTLQVTCATNANYTCAPSALSISSTATSTTTTTGTAATGTILTVTPTNPAAGAVVMLTATVTPTTASATALSGTVSFYNGTTLIGSGTVSSSTVSGAAVGVATASVTLTGTSPYTLTASYSGNTTYATSTSTAVTVSSTAVASSISLSANTTAILSGIDVTFTAIVGGPTATGATAGATPTGTVYFYLAGSSPQLLGTAVLGASGAGLSTAVFSTSTIPAGSAKVYAVYGGDTNFGAVTSADITLGVTDYSLTFIPQTLTLTPGQTGTVTAILGVSGFTGTVVFGCTPPPNAGITCAFSPASLHGSGITTMTVVTTAARSAALHVPGMSSGIFGGAALAGLLCFLIPARKRRLPVMLLAALALGLTFSMGCGAGDFSSNPASASSGGTPLGTSFITINTAGTDGVNTVTHNYTYQVTIQ